MVLFFFIIQSWPHVARRVAEAAVKSGVAGIVIDDFDAYEKELTLRLMSR